MNATQGKSLADIAQLVHDELVSVGEAIETLNERLARAKPGSFKARRTALAIAQLESKGGLNVKAAFEGAKGKPKAKPAAKAKAKAKAKPAAKAADLGSIVANMDEEQLAGVMALIVNRLKD